jgi:long-chain acyl-CoA synthetase
VKIGGENIYPLEIEERLLEHPAISYASIVGLKDDKYGEAVAAFLQLRPNHNKPSLAEVTDWVRQRLARHKAPAHCFWVGPSEQVTEYPLTGNGKIRKEILREIGQGLVGPAKKPVLAKL